MQPPTLNTCIAFHHHCLRVCAHFDELWAAVSSWPWVVKQGRLLLMPARTLPLGSLKRSELNTFDNKSKSRVFVGCHSNADKDPLIRCDDRVRDVAHH